MVSPVCCAVYHRGAKFEAAASTPAIASTPVRLRSGRQLRLRREATASLSHSAPIASRK